MRSSCTSCAHTKTFDLGYPPKAPDNKLEFVEHVLGVLIESRFGTDDPYSRLGEPPVTTGHSQMFANVRLLSTAEIEARLRSADLARTPFYAAFLRELPLALANGAWLPARSGFRPKVAWAKARVVVAALNRRLNPTATPVDRAISTLLRPTNLARGSPPFLGRISFMSPTATCR